MLCIRGWVSAIGAGAAVLLLSGISGAFEAGEVGGHELTIDFTETAVAGYHFNNRNTNLLQPSTRVDDDYGEWINRLTTQVSWWRLQLGVRLDSAVYFDTPNPNTLAAEDVKMRPGPQPGEIDYPTDAQYKQQRTQIYGRELSNRYLNTIYPSKLYLSYASPGVEVTVGDAYAQLGRGLVLSVRKIDELSIDTTVRGGKASVLLPVGDRAKVGFTMIGGYMNPLRVDEMSGRILQQMPMWIFPGMPQVVPTTYTENPVPSFAPDSISGGSVESRTRGLVLSTQAVVLNRMSPCGLAGASSTQCTDFVMGQYIRGATQVRNISGAVSIPDIAGHGSFYLEVAAQQQQSPHPDPGTYNPTTLIPRSPADDTTGYAIYAALTANGGPFSATIEGKHYRKFWPLMANVNYQSTSNGVPEYQQLQYSAPPTTEAIYVDTEYNYFNTCVTGGRARVDARATGNLIAYAWLGRWTTWGEHGAGECNTADNSQRNNVWDFAVGLEGRFDEKRSHVFAWAGARDDRTAESYVINNAPTNMYYQEGYIRYDIVKHLVKAFSLQLTGVARHRDYRASGMPPWWEGENYLALQWSPRLTAAVGYEFLLHPATQVSSDVSTSGIDPNAPPSYFNGSVTWRFTSDTSLQVFVGQQRGALRCISGVCRVFPPYEGAKAQLVWRF